MACDQQALFNKRILLGIIANLSICITLDHKKVEFVLGFLLLLLSKLASEWFTYDIVDLYSLIIEDYLCCK